MKFWRPASFRFLAVLLAHVGVLDKELDVEEVVGPQGTLDVVDHPLGAGPEEVAELGGAGVRQGLDGDAGAAALGGRPGPGVGV